MKRITAAMRLLAVAGVACLLAVPAARAGDEGYLGVVLQEIGPGMAKALQLEDEGGVLVNRVVKDSPAAAAGLQDGDVILTFAGERLADPGDLTRAVRGTEPGDEVDIVVLRGGERRTLTAKIGEHEGGLAWFGRGGDGDFAFRFEDDEGGVHVLPRGGHDVWVRRFGDDDDVAVHVERLFGDRGYLGIHMDAMGEQMREYFGVDGGALVTEVTVDSPAAEAGLKAGDVIVKVDDRDVDAPDALREALAGSEAGQEVTVEFIRKGDRKRVAVTLAERPDDMFGGHLRILGDGDEYHVVPPKMMHRMPHLKRQMHMAPDGETLRGMVPDHEELSELKDEVDKLRRELREMRDELRER